LGSDDHTTVSNSYNAGLPSINVKFDLTSDMLLRLGASKTLTRPNLGQMGVDNWYGGRAGYVTSGGGNPYLKPMRRRTSTCPTNGICRRPTMSARPCF
jgi:outer membrane receptor protein involved in Fe transport